MELRISGLGIPRLDISQLPLAQTLQSLSTPLKSNPNTKPFFQLAAPIEITPIENLLRWPANNLVPQSLPPQDNRLGRLYDSRIISVRPIAELLEPTFVRQVSEATRIASTDSSTITGLDFFRSSPIDKIAAQTTESVSKALLPGIENRAGNYQPIAVPLAALHQVDVSGNRRTELNYRFQKRARPMLWQRTPAQPRSSQPRKARNTEQPKSLLGQVLQKLGQMLTKLVGLR